MLCFTLIYTILQKYQRLATQQRTREININPEEIRRALIPGQVYRMIRSVINTQRLVSIVP